MPKVAETARSCRRHFRVHLSLEVSVQGAGRDIAHRGIASALAMKLVYRVDVARTEREMPRNAIELATIPSRGIG